THTPIFSIRAHLFLRSPCFQPPLVASAVTACYKRRANGRATSAAEGERTMRFFRRALVVPIALSALVLISSPASALISTQLSIGQPKLGPLGASVSVPLRFTCDPSFN